MSLFQFSVVEFLEETSVDVVFSRWIEKNDGVSVY